METVILAAVFLLAASHASASVIGGLKGTWYGSCTTPNAVTANHPDYTCIPGGGLITQPYTVTFNADETWNWTIADKQVKFNGKNYKAEMYSVPTSPLTFVKMLDNGFCADNGFAYITIIRTVVKLATGGTMVMYEEIGYDGEDAAVARALGCPPAASPIFCDGNRISTYRCAAIRQEE